MNNTVQTYELKKKIAQVFQVHPESSRRISEYINTTSFVLEQSDLYTQIGRITQEQIDTLREEFKQISLGIISLEISEIIEKLKNNPPKTRGTESNSEVFKKAFIH